MLFATLCGKEKKSMAENARKVIKTQAAKFKIRDSSFSRSRSLALCSAWFFLRRVAIHDLVTPPFQDETSGLTIDSLRDRALGPG
jgi:hypothetical protein